MTEPSAVSRLVAGLAKWKGIAPAAFMAAMTALIPVIFWNWGAPYEKPLRLIVLVGLLIPMAISTAIAWRGASRSWMRPAILIIDAVAGTVIAATIVLILLRT